MAETNSVSIDTSKDVAQPTLEQEAARLETELAKQNAPKDPAAKDRPEWLPEKFATAENPLEAVSKAYTELEKKLGEKKPTEETKPDEQTEKTPEQKATSEAEAAAREAAKKSGLDLNALSQKFWDKGALEDTDYTALEKAGYPKAIVDQFIEGQRAVVTQRASAVFAEAGGEDNYKAMVQWASQNMKPNEVAAFNTAVNGNDMNQIMLAVKGLKAQHDAAVGTEPTDALNGHTGVKPGSSVYRSVAELMRDQGDPRYWNDPAFRQDVIQKLQRSDIL